MGKSAWHENWQEKCEQAAVYLRAASYLRAKSYLLGSHDLRKPLDAFLAELTTFMNFTIYKSVFESNRIEKAGLNDSDTKKLILDEYYNLSQGKSLESLFLNDKIRFSKSQLIKQRKQGSLIIFQGKKRSAREVILHKLAVEYASFLYSTIKLKHLREKVKDTVAMRYPFLVNKFQPSLAERLSVERDLFSERTLHDLHFLMANGLIRKDAGVQAGFYRQDDIVTDSQTYYQSPENVPRAMKEFVRKANRLLKSVDNPIIKAARISYDFVGIHPFPDFNGRMSRLIMNMVLWYEGLPFMAVLRGNAKEKHRYIYSLRRANRGNIGWYAALIATAVSDGFEQLNSNLKRAGLKEIQPLTKRNHRPSKEGR